MHDHQVERHRQRRLIAVHHHAERIADEQEIDIGVDDLGGMGVIGRQRNDRLAAFARGDIGRGDPLDLRLLRHATSSRYLRKLLALTGYWRSPRLNGGDLAGGEWGWKRFCVKAGRGASP
jgi:hypothetical protein